MFTMYVYGKHLCMIWITEFAKSSSFGLPMSIYTECSIEWNWLCTRIMQYNTKFCQKYVNTQIHTKNLPELNSHTVHLSSMTNWSNCTTAAIGCILLILLLDVSHRKMKKKKKHFVRISDLIKNVFTHKWYKSLASFRMRRHSAFMLRPILFSTKYTNILQENMCMLRYPASIMHVYGVAFTWNYARVSNKIECERERESKNL